MSLQDEQNLEQSYVMPTFARKPVEFVEGRGMTLIDDKGGQYLDFLSGIGVCSLGHCHPSVVEAITAQAQKLIHVSNYYYIEKRGEVAKTLSELLSYPSGDGAAANGDSQVPYAASSQKGKAVLEKYDGAWKSFFANSGAEANECAIKLARLFAQKKALDAGKSADAAPSIVVTLAKSFHGRTLATLAATGQRALHKGFEPIPEGFLPTPINDCEALKQIFESIGKSICAVMIEPIQGESGVHVCTQDFLMCARKLTQDHGAFLIFDEVQCGMFRTGKPFAFQNYGVTPDVVSMAKGIASGMPAGACAARADIADVMQPGKHGSTFGGSNLAISAIHATLNELKKPGFSENVIKVGNYLHNRLMGIKGVLEVRGIALMAGIDLVDEIDAAKVVSRALENRLVINATGPHTLRFLPPLIASESDVDTFIDRLTKSIEESM